MAFVSQNGLWLTRGNQVGNVRADGLIEAMATGKLSLSSTNGVISILASSSNVVLGGKGNVDTVTIGSNLTTINGDLDINGTVDMLYANDVVVRNKLIVVASVASSNDGGPLTDGSGLMVSDIDSMGGVDERSIVWRSGTSSQFSGVSLTADGATSNQGCWEVSGGALRITMPVPAGSNSYPGNQNVGYAAGRDVSYGFRINKRDEMELFKRVLPFSCNQNEAAASYRVVARFGGAAGAISLPRSANPYGH